LCVLGVSLNVKEQVHASVWQLSNLPMDCNQVSEAVLRLPADLGQALLQQKHLAGVGEKSEVPQRYKSALSWNGCSGLKKEWRYLRLLKSLPSEPGVRNVVNISDLLELLGIPQPVGGILVMGANELIYLNQSVPPCG
uniref:RMI1_N domain-containing protein n=1 Tax=Gongylonema pulchrum TaxID=637853 RepID=A0A183D6N5_9BILA